VVTEEVIVADADPILVYRSEAETISKDEKEKREFGSGSSSN